MTDQTEEVVSPAPTSDEPNLKTKTGKPAPVLLVFLMIPLLGILIALLMIALEPPTQPETTTADLQARSMSLIDFAAPHFELSNLDGERVTLADYEGQPLFLNFWQTTCAPCVRELPAFAEFDAEQDQAAVLAINFDETSQDIRNFFEENGIEGVPVALDPDSGVRRSYGVEFIPTTFVIDSDGVVRFIKLGELTFDDMGDYLDILNNINVGSESES